MQVLKGLSTLVLSVLKVVLFILEFEQIHFSVNLQSSFSLTCLLYLKLYLFCFIKSVMAGSIMI